MSPMLTGCPALSEQADDGPPPGRVPLVGLAQPVLDHAVQVTVCPLN